MGGEMLRLLLSEKHSLSVLEDRLGQDASDREGDGGDFITSVMISA
jgi:hypothetical protein